MALLKSSHEAQPAALQSQLADLPTPTLRFSEMPARLRRALDPLLRRAR
jgi:hypothetical protein